MYFLTVPTLAKFLLPNPLSPDGGYGFDPYVGQLQFLAIKRFVFCSLSLFFSFLARVTSLAR